MWTEFSRTAPGTGRWTLDDTVSPKVLQTTVHFSTRRWLPWTIRLHRGWLWSWGCLLVACSILLLLRLPAGYANAPGRLAAYTRHFWLCLPPPSLYTQMPNSPTLGAENSVGCREWASGDQPSYNQPLTSPRLWPSVPSFFSSTASPEVTEVLVAISSRGNNHASLKLK